MKLNKLAAIPAIALAATLGLAACSGSSGNPGPGGSAPQQQKTLVRIQETHPTPDGTVYTNIWSDGSQTRCVVETPGNAQVATGNCAPDGIANGTTYSQN